MWLLEQTGPHNPCHFYSHPSVIYLTYGMWAETERALIQAKLSTIPALPPTHRGVAKCSSRSAIKRGPSRGNSSSYPCPSCIQAHPSTWSLGRSGPGLRGPAPRWPACCGALAARSPWCSRYAPCGHQSRRLDISHCY